MFSSPSFSFETSTKLSSLSLALRSFGWEIVAVKVGWRCRVLDLPFERPLNIHHRYVQSPAHNDECWVRSNEKLLTSQINLPHRKSRKVKIVYELEKTRNNISLRQAQTNIVCLADGNFAAHWPRTEERHQVYRLWNLVMNTKKSTASLHKARTHVCTDWGTRTT